MVDVRLITLLPPPAIAQPTGAQPVTTQGATVVPQLPAGSILSGFIINRDPAGNPILRTDRGDFAFTSNLFLKIGSEVVIRIQQTAGHASAHIVSVNGQSPEASAQQTSFSDGPEPVTGRTPQPAAQQQSTPQTQTAPTTATSPTLPTPKTGQTISAIVVTPAFSPSAAPGVTPGTSFLLSVLGVNQTPTAQTQTRSPLAQLTPAAPAAAPSAPSATSALSSLLPSAPATVTTPATNATTAAAPPATPAATVQTPAALPPGQVAPSAASNQQAATAQFSGPLGQTITATVVAAHPDGSVTLGTAIGTLRAAEIGGLPIGQQLTLRVSSVANPNNYTVALANSAAPAPPAPLTELARAWTSLQQIAQILGAGQAGQFIPTIPTAALNSDTPGRITQSASQILFFIAALKGGNFRDWLGNTNVKALEEKGYGSLVRKAEGEFLQMARQFAEPLPGNWQSNFFPVMVAGELQQVRAFVKREKKKDEQGRPTKDEDTRFVVEMSLSVLGEMQMDGLVKRREDNLQFDLIIRSLHPLPTSLEQDIQSIFIGTAEATGTRGQISFQAVHSFPLHPLEDTTPHVFDDVVV
ncbi:MAG: hypothetical protein SFX19_00075 [Alphaproteobacteria bacterium]|nr:hypothetical protein [Alphaproteobacteria bacterium]